MNTSIVSDERKRRSSYFFPFHLELADKYKTEHNHFDHQNVGFIRESFFRYGMDKKKTMKRAEEMMMRSHDHRNHNVTWYLRLYNFLKNCSDEAWSDLTQPYPPFKSTESTLK